MSAHAHCRQNSVCIAEQDLMYSATPSVDLKDINLLLCLHLLTLFLCLCPISFESNALVPFYPHHVSQAVRLGNLKDVSCL